MNLCNEWMVDNNLTIHPDKKEFIVFSTKRKLKHTKNVCISFRNIIKCCQSSVKYPGCYLDNDLSGSTTVKNITRKTSAKIKFLQKNCRNLSYKTSKLLSNSLIQPYFDYCSSSLFSELTEMSKNNLGQTGAIPHAGLFYTRAYSTLLIFEVHF